MAAPVFNLTKDGKFIFDMVVENVKFYLADDAGKFAGEAGHLSKAGVKIMLTEEATNLIDNSNWQRGYNLQVEITSEQFFSAFEFDKLKNRLCYIEVVEIPLWVLPVRLNVSIPEFNPGEKRAQIIIKAQKYGKNLNALLASSWNGNVFEPFAVPVTPGPGTNTPIPADGSLEYLFDLLTDNPLVEIITPAAPTSEDALTELKLLLVDQFSEPLLEAPTVTDVEYWDGFLWQALVVATDYTAIFEDNYYKVYINNALLDVLFLKTRVKVTYTL